MTLRRTASPHRTALRPGTLGTLGRFGGALLGAVARLWRLHRNRRTAISLLDLDADRLADIGLTRADVRLSLFDPRTPDPTRLLGTVAAERRRAGRREQ